MRIAQFIVVGILPAFFMATAAMSQDMSSQSSRYYVSADDDANAGASQENRPSAATEANSATAEKDNTGDEEAKSSCRWCRNGKLGDPWTLPQPDCLKAKNITIGGWIEGGIYGNQYGEPNNGPIGLRGIGDGFTADQIWVFAERKTDTKGCGWDLGGRVDYLFGVDAPQTQAFGDHSWDYDWNTSSQYGFAMPQAYAEVACNDVKVKLGHFYTPIGYEVVQATGNFFYSHSYSHTYGEPFTHTGALANYAPNEKLTWYGGWTNGWDEGFAGKNDGSTFLGGFSLNVSKKTTLAWYVSAGRLGSGNAFAGAASGNIYYNCIILTHKLTDKWTYAFEHDLGVNSDVDQADRVDNQWYQINNYLTYKLNDCWSLGGRIEWFQDPQGARVSPGSRGDYFAMTAGVNYKPHANVTIRPEIRYDWFDRFNGTTALPFNNGLSSSQLSGGFDMIFTF